MFRLVEHLSPSKAIPLFVGLALLVTTSALVMLGISATERQVQQTKIAFQTHISEILAQGIANNTASSIDTNTTGLRSGFLVPDASMLSREPTEATALPSTVRELGERAIASGQIQTETVGETRYIATPIDADASSNAQAYLTTWDIAPSAASGSAMLQLIIIAAFVGIFCFTVGAYVLHRTIAKPIADLAKGAASLASGRNLTELPHQQSSNEFGLLAQSLLGLGNARREEIAEIDAQDVKVLDECMAKSARIKAMHSALADAVRAGIKGDFKQDIVGGFPDDDTENLARLLNDLLRAVDENISSIGTTLAAISKGDLTNRVKLDCTGRFEDLKKDTNVVAENLEAMMSKLNMTSNALKIATEEIHAGAHDLSQRTTQQAAEIEETSSSMARISVAVMENAKQAERAHSIVQKVSQNAAKSATVMAETQAAMERINASSEKIADIIGLIDNVAFQTNLLALNASVEAARAGEAGKGFAVVAEEVRRLAQTAAGASADIDQLITKSTEEVGTGTALVSEAGTKIGDMVTAAQQNSAIMEGIVKECREQAIVIEEVNAAVGRMDTMTQNNAALVEETNASIAQTKDQVKTLDTLVDLFRIGRLDGAPQDTSQMISQIEADRISDASGLGSTTGDAEPSQETRKSAYKTVGNTALNEDWSEF